MAKTTAKKNIGASPQRNYNPIHWIANILRRWKNLKPSEGLFGLGLLGLWIFLLGGSLYKTTFNFKLDATVRSLDFTYTGDHDQGLFNEISDLKALTIQGQIDNDLVLNGTFRAPDNPELVPVLQDLDQLTLKLNTFDSQLTLTTPQAKTQYPLSLLTLNITPNTRVEALTYSPKSRNLSLNLCRPTTSTSTCGTFQDIPTEAVAPSEATDQPPLPHSQLELQTGSGPLQLVIDFGDIPELRDTLIESDTVLPDQLTLLFTPTELSASDPHVLELGHYTQIKTTVPKPDDAIDPDTGDQRPWLNQDLTVSKLALSRYTEAAEASAAVYTSTILKGSATGPTGKSIKLDRQQFLILDDGPGVEKVRSLQINTKDPQGIQILASGKTNQLATGLYTDAPLQSITQPWLTQYLSEFQIGGIIGFISSLTLFFLPRILDDDD